MPELSSLQLLDRIEERLRDLEAGNELEAREINVLLTTQQRQQLKADWQAQQKLSAGGGFHFNDLSQG